MITLTRLRAGHYIFGGFSITRHITDDSTYWVVSWDSGKEMEVVENFDKARDLVSKKAGERYARQLLEL